MAPSPTGEYHIGHIRTLLYNWAFAKKYNGDFILRIEDTDRERFVAGATDRILEVIKSYGLVWDEGPQVGGPHEPYFQSQRLEIYQKHAQILLDKGAAYYCFCTEERLEKMREEQKARHVVSTKYDRLCLKLDKSEIEKKLKDKVPYVIRMKVPDNKEITFNDLVIGDISVPSSDIDDQVLIKSDGFPTYHFAVVIDDHLMEISHVMRGNDWIPSTPKHVLLYQAFGWDMPYFAHIPNLKEMGAGKKLSKRFGAVAAKEFLDEGYLPEAVLNFLMFLGWNPGTDKEIYTLNEFVKDFSIEKIHKTDLVAFDRNKLLWMNSQYIQKSQISDLPDGKAGLKSQIFKFFGGKYDAAVIEKILPLLQTRIKTLKEFADLAGFFFEKPKVDKKILSNNWKNHLSMAVEVLESLEKWGKSDIDEGLLSAVKEKNFKTGEFFMDFRIAVTGSKFTPPINESIVILGKYEVLKRLKAVLGSKSNIKY